MLSAALSSTHKRYKGAPSFHIWFKATLVLTSREAFTPDTAGKVVQVLEAVLKL